VPQQATTAGADYSGAMDKSYQGLLANNNADNAAAGNTQAAVGTAAMAAAMFF
jgi:hypothetical protein